MDKQELTVAILENQISLDALSELVESNELDEEIALDSISEARSIVFDAIANTNISEEGIIDAIDSGLMSEEEVNAFIDGLTYFISEAECSGDECKYKKKLSASELKKILKDSKKEQDETIKDTLSSK